MCPGLHASRVFFKPRATSACETAGNDSQTRHVSRRRDLEETWYCRETVEMVGSASRM